MQVFSQLFGTSVEPAGPLSEPTPDALPESLKKPVHALHHVLAAILSQPLSAAQADTIAGILKHTIQELSSHVQSD